MSMSAPDLAQHRRHGFGIYYADDGPSGLAVIPLAPWPSPSDTPAAVRILDNRGWRIAMVRGCGATYAALPGPHGDSVPLARAPSLAADWPHRYALVHACQTLLDAGSAPSGLPRLAAEAGPLLSRALGVTVELQLDPAALNRLRVTPPASARPTPRRRNAVWI
jgi:hypothetical protein